MRIHQLIAGWAFFVSLCVIQKAYATLGETADSIENDRQALDAKSIEVIQRKNYVIYQFETAVSTIREFVGPSNLVFGIAWMGFAHPDEAILLGNYKSEQDKALSFYPRSPGSRRHRVDAGHFVFEKSGHGRQVQGRAFDFTLIPKGLDTDEVH